MGQPLLIPPLPQVSGVANNSAMTPDQLAQLRHSLDAMERLLVALTAELKTIREELHAAAVAPEIPAEPRR